MSQLIRPPYYYCTTVVYTRVLPGLSTNTGGRTSEWSTRNQAPPPSPGHAWARRIRNCSPTMPNFEQKRASSVVSPLINGTANQTKSHLATTTPYLSSSSGEYPPHYGVRRQETPNRIEHTTPSRIGQIMRPSHTANKMIIHR
jgi:hypothetical protein